MAAPRRGTASAGQRRLRSSIHHQGTKNTKAAPIANTKTQRHEEITKPAISPQITQIDPDGVRKRTPPIGRTVFNAKSQSPPAHPCNAETRSRRGAEGLSPAGFLCVARFWPSSDGQTTPLLFFLIQELDRPCNQHNKKEGRQNRRAKGTSAGEKRGGDERSGSEPASFSPATGDFRSPVVLPGIISIARQAQQHSLCGSASLRFLFVMPLCLCVFVVATWVDGRIWVYLGDL